MSTKLNPRDFAESIRTTYPGQYDSIKDDMDLTQAILESHPEMKDLVDFGPQDLSAPKQPMESWEQQHPMANALEKTSEAISNVKSSLSEMPKSAFKGFMEQPLQDNAPVAQKIAHVVGENAFPVIPAMAVSPFNAVIPGISVVAATGGKAAQKILQQGVAATGLAYPPVQTPKTVGMQVAGAGLAEYLGNKVGEKLSAIYSGGKKAFVKLVSKTRDLSESDILHAIEFPNEVFSGRTQEEIDSFYKAAVTKKPQPDLPNMPASNEAPEELMKANDYIQQVTGQVQIPKSEWMKFANKASDAVINGGENLLTKETGKLTPQEALVGIQSINKAKYDYGDTTLVNPEMIKERLYDYLEKSGYPDIRDAALVVREGKIAERFSDFLPKGGNVLVGMAGIGMEAAGMATNNRKLKAAGILATLASSPYLQGKTIHYGSPIFGVVSKNLKEAYNITSPLAVQAIVSELNSKLNSGNEKSNTTSPLVRELKDLTTAPQAIRPSSKNLSDFMRGSKGKEVAKPVSYFTEEGSAELGPEYDEVDRSNLPINETNAPIFGFKPRPAYVPKRNIPKIRPK
jgi:hypothetical protein